jgi:hypothetical protein
VAGSRLDVVLRAAFFATVLGGSGWLLVDCSPCDGLGRGASFDAQSIVLGPNKAGVVVAVPYATIEGTLGESEPEPIDRTRSLVGEALHGRAASPAWTLGRPDAFPDCQNCVTLTGSVPVELRLGPEGSEPDGLPVTASCQATVVAAAEVGCAAGDPVLPIRTRSSSFGSHAVELADCAELDLGDEAATEQARALAREVVEARAEAAADLLLGDLLFWRLQDMGVAPARVEVYSDDDHLKLAMYPARTLPGPEIPVELVEPRAGEDLSFAVAPSMLAVLASDLELREQNPPFKDPGGAKIGYRPVLMSLVGTDMRLGMALRATRAEGCGWIDQTGGATVRWDADVQAARFDQTDDARFLEIGGSEGGRPLTTTTRGHMFGQYLKQMGRQLEHRPWRGPGKQGMKAVTARMQAGFVEIGAQLSGEVEPDFVAPPPPIEIPDEPVQQALPEEDAEPEVGGEEESEAEVGGEEEAEAEVGGAEEATEPQPAIKEETAPSGEPPPQ